MNDAHSGTAPPRPAPTPPTADPGRHAPSPPGDGPARPDDAPEPGEDTAGRPPDRGGWRRVAGPLVGLATVVGAVWLTLTVWEIVERHPRTDDAFLRANVVGISPRVKGQLLEIYVQDNQAVQAGEPLFRIDPADYQQSLDKARSALAALDQQIEVARAQDTNLQYQIKAALASVEGARLQLKQADDTLHRMEPLLLKGFTSAEDLDKARTSRDVAAAACAAQQQQLEQARTTVSPLRELLAQRPGAEADLSQAALNLSYCRVVAPVPGRIVNLNVSVGAYVNAGSPLFAMIDTRHWYVIADFREAELRHAPPGTLVDVYLPAVPDRRFVGRVQGVGWAVQPDESESDPAGQLPKVTRELNWVHIAQRFPVRIEIEQPDQDLFRMGATAVAVVR